VGAEARGVAFIAHVTDEEVFFGVLEVESSFKRAELHHAGVEAVAEEDDAGVFFEFERGRGGGEKSEEKEEEVLHEGRGILLVVIVTRSAYFVDSEGLSMG